MGNSHTWVLSLVQNRTEQNRTEQNGTIEITDIRNRYIPIFYRNNPSMYKLMTLINNENKNIIRNLGVFIQEAFELRNSIHYAYILTNFE